MASENTLIYTQTFSVQRANREDMLGHGSMVIWITGLSGADKSTIANKLEEALHAQGKLTYILDGDNVRAGLNKDLGFSSSDRIENIRRTAEVAKLMMDAGLIVIAAFVSPLRHERDMAKNLIGASNFLEVFVNTPLEICQQRDPKGLYEKAKLGQIKNMTGITSPYEPPLQPECVLDTSIKDVDTCINELLAHINRVLS